MNITKKQFDLAIQNATMFKDMFLFLKLQYNYTTVRKAIHKYAEENSIDILKMFEENKNKINHKICLRCNKDKLFEEFNFKNKKKNTRQAHCRECHQEESAKRYKQYIDYYKEKSKKDRLEIVEWFNNYKKSLKCYICGEDDSCCLDFHHRDVKEKEQNISNAVHRNWSINRLLKEIEKCIVLCRNCHTKLHYYGSLGNLTAKIIYRKVA